MDRQSEQYLKRELENALQFRQLTESLPHQLWSCSRDGLCDYLSPQWVAYTGIAEEEGWGRAWMKQVHPDDGAMIQFEWKQALDSGKQFDVEYRMLGADGNYRWFQARSIPLRDEANEIVKWFGISTDIHDSRLTREALEREKKRLAKLVALAPAVFCSFSIRPDGSYYFSYASPDIADLTGLELEALQRDAGLVWSLLSAGETARLRASFETVAEKLVPWRVQCPILHASRGERWIEAHFSPTIEADGTVVWHGFLTDISDRKSVENDQNFLLRLGAELQATNDPLAIAQISARMVTEHFDLSRCSFSSVDAARWESTLLCQYTRQGRAQSPGGTYSLNQWATDELRVKMTAGETVVVEDTAIHPATAAYFHSSFEPADIRAMIAVPLLRGGRWVGVLRLFSATTRTWPPREIRLSRTAAERIWPAYEAARALAAERVMHETLAASEERLRVALQSSAIGIWETNAITGQRHWDTRCKEMFGFPPDTMVNTPLVLACIHPEDRAAVQRLDQEYYDPAGSGRFDAEFRILTWDDSRLRHIYAQGQMSFEGEGEERGAVRSIGTLQDVTALKQGEQALRRVNHELEQFAYAAAHDLQEPLRNVGLATQILASRYDKEFDADGKSLLTTAVEGSMRMQAMVKDLLAFSRALTSEDGPVPSVNADSVLSAALTNLSLAIEEKQAQFSCEHLPTVRMKEFHLLQIFQNLLGNSLKYCGTKRPSIHISTTRRRGQCAFFVQDNGLGIPAEFHERAFGVFKRLHSQDVPGTGIGLALCKRIVEHYGGKIWIESKEHEGATVFFTLPLGDEKWVKC